MSENRFDLTCYAKVLSQSQGYISGQVELSSTCFQKCKYCSSWKHDLSIPCSSNERVWDFESLVEFFQELARDFPLFEHLSLTGGDPQAWMELTQFLEWYVPRRPFLCELQISTAFCRDLSKKEEELWRGIRDVRISLDAYDRDIYQKVRGDKKTDPQQVLARILSLQHSRLSIITTLYPANVDFFPELVKAIHEFSLKEDCKIRRIIVMAGIGEAHKHTLESQDFHRRWKIAMKAVQAHFLEVHRIPVNIQENALDLESEREEAQKEDCPCYVGSSSFHVKYNGDLYPCCLVGGEALETNKNFIYGNIWKESLKEIWKEHSIPDRYYGPDKDEFCRTQCQWKQLKLNREALKAAHCVLAIP